MAARDDAIARLRKRMEVMTSSMQSMIPLILEKAEQDAASEGLEEKKQHSGFGIADAANRYACGIFLTKLIHRMISEFTQPGKQSKKINNKQRGE
ncbi:unnamed protein product [Arabidopsis lyrata]|nr:unnamed protein product [Arabidopsis lyrata]